MKRFLFLSLLSASTALAQPFETAWSFGGVSSDVAEAITTDPEGNLYVVGTFEGSMDFGNDVAITSAGDSDAFLVKFGTDGEAQWARRAGTDVFNDFGGAVAVERASLQSIPAAVYFAGTFTGIATFDGGSRPDTTITTFSDFDAFLARYTPDGDLDWVRRVGGTEQDVAHGIAVDPYDEEDEEDVYLTGSFTGEAEAGDTTLVSAGSSDAYLVRFTPSGDLVWARSAGGTSSDAGYDVVVTSEDEAFVTGQFNGVAVFEDGIALQSVGLSDVYVARYGDDGTAAWAQRLGGSGSDFVRGIAASSQGFTSTEQTTLFVGGSFSESMLAGSDVLTSAGFTDVFVAALDAEGTVLWGRRGGGTSFDFAEDVQTLPPYAVPVRGDVPTATPVYLTGYIDTEASFDAPEQSIALNSEGGLDGFLAAYESGSSFNGGIGGTLIEAFAFGGTNRDQGTGLAILPQSVEVDGTFVEGLGPVIAGSFRGTATLGNLTVESTGSNDGFVAWLTSCPTLFCLPTALEPGSGQPTETALGAAFPNPFHDRATLALDLAEAQTVTVALFDVLGRRVAVLHDGPLTVGAHRVVIEAGALPAGVYVVRAEGEAFHQSQRLTVIR